MIDSNRTETDPQAGNEGGPKKEQEEGQGHGQNKDHDPKFASGSIMRHVLVMSSTGAVGLLSIFFVDALNLFYISLLGQQELAAAIGYASSLMFFSISFSVGFAIAATALTARALGSGDKQKARQVAAVSLCFTIAMGVTLALALYWFLEPVIHYLGATKETGEIAIHFMTLVIPSIPFLFISMSLSGLIRAAGDARRSMYVTLAGAGAAILLDPILIIGLKLEITGAAISVCFSRALMAYVGWWGAQKVHDLLALPKFSSFLATSKPFFAIALPAVLTQIATPVGNAYLTRTISQFGDDAVAGWAILGRLIPLAFAGIYALTGAIGPIISQNLGAGKTARITQTLNNSLLVITLYTLAIWALLALGAPTIAKIFNASGDAVSMIDFFCLYVAGSFLFNGALFVTNAAFNNLDYPLLSTLFNWGRATIGTIPFAWIGSTWGPNGIIAGWGLGGILFGTAAIITCRRVLQNLDARPKVATHIPTVPGANSPFSSGKASTISTDAEFYSDQTGKD